MKKRMSKEKRRHYFRVFEKKKIIFYPTLRQIFEFSKKKKNNFLSGILRPSFPIPQIRLNYLKNLMCYYNEKVKRARRGDDKKKKKA